MEFQHATIRELIEGLGEQQLRERADPSKWSIFENIVHLATYQPVFLQRLDRMQNEESPAFARYLADDDPQFAIDLQLPLASLLDDIDARRSDIRSKLQGMTEGELSRTGVHPLFGKLSILRWTEFFLLHEAHHLYTIFRLVQTSRAGLR